MANEPNVPAWALELAASLWPAAVCIPEVARALVEAYENGLEEAAKVADGWDQIHGGPARLPAAIRALKSPRQDDTAV